MKQRIAIIGTGISGLTCAYLLHRDHDIQVYEANDYIGGHTHTVDIEVDGQSHAIDTGFIVFNDWTYPNFIKLLDQLQVKRQPTEMSFSVRNQDSGLEYNGNNLNSLFAQRRNLLRPTFWRFIREILRFNKLCKSFSAEDPALPQTLGELLARERFSDSFQYDYILPMCAAIWSASIEDVRQFPLQFFLRFFNNHGLLNVSDRPQWYTLMGGSRAYIKPLTQGFADRIHLSTPIHSILRTEHGYRVTNGNKHLGDFDQVILACHSDQALQMLQQPTTQQRAVLDNIRYASNEVVLHTDTQLLPKRRLAWASWNYSVSNSADARQAPASVTYNMNILQRLQTPTTFCVTLNNTAAINPDKILRRFNYSHPQYDQATLDAQQARSSICGVDGLHFCGAYWYNGFHEDGVRSALDVCARFGASL